MPVQSPFNQANLNDRSTPMHKMKRSVSAWLPRATQSTRIRSPQCTSVISNVREPYQQGCHKLQGLVLKHKASRYAGEKPNFHLIVYCTPFHRQPEI